MTTQTATAKPYRVKRMEPNTPLREQTLENGMIVAMRTPNRVMWAVVIGEQGVLWNDRDNPVIFDRKSIAELEADYFNRIAELSAEEAPL